MELTRVHTTSSDLKKASIYKVYKLYDSNIIEM